MRLLHTQSLELCEFLENATPPYAILSHTWEQEEVTYQDMQRPDAKLKDGYTKIERCCDQAVGDGYDYVWIDTCCIDKSSSAELSEAINSMYVWYKNAKICYAYLADVGPILNSNPSKPLVSFKESRWFTRGWTLQELIAPARVEFFAWNWSPYGTKAELHSALSEVTGIDEATLRGSRNLREVSIAKRMSWASKRVTTRVEDIAYCLLGIFGVNLPLLYGEGEKAFIRLQEEIMRNSDDHSLFAWGLTQEEYSAVHSSHAEAERISGTQSSTLWGFLARSPAAFENSTNIVPYRNWETSMPYSMTNQGLRLELPVIQHEAFKEYTAILACHYEDNYLGPLGVYISPVASADGDQFARDVWHMNPVLIVPQHAAQAKLRTIYIRQDILLPTVRDFDRRDHFLIRTMPEDPEEGYALDKVYPPEHWNQAQKIIRSENSEAERIGILLFGKKKDSKKPLLSSSDHKFLKTGPRTTRTNAHAVFSSYLDTQQRTNGLTY
ncbi:HET-domain-containing protein [Stipitochalara longipes BDJ]|nr:HET-domain-containing protein [Stipitochalara longipes BDJ]